jgi:hypothetical protein
MSSQKSRAEKMAEKIREGMDEPLSDEAFEANVEIQETMVEFENQDYWSLYRSLDVSQSDVREMVSTLFTPSQSTVSRVIREKEDTVLTDEEAIQIGGSLHEEDLDYYPDEWLDAYRQVLADAHADLNALSKIASMKETPEWAARRFPELVGCARDRADRLPGNEEIPDDSHLSHLESVNTDRWG